MIITAAQRRDVEDEVYHTSVMYCCHSRVSEIARQTRIDASIVKQICEEFREDGIFSYEKPQSYRYIDKTPCMGITPGALEKIYGPKP